MDESGSVLRRALRAYRPATTLVAKRMTMAMVAVAVAGTMMDDAGMMAAMTWVSKCTFMRARTHARAHARTHRKKVTYLGVHGKGLGDGVAAGAVAEGDGGF